MVSTDSLIFADQHSASRLSRQAAAGKVRRLAVGVYTDDVTTPLDVVAKLHWLELFEHFFPGGVITDRSAPRGSPDEQGLLFVVHSRKRPLSIPGLTIVPRKGAPGLATDTRLGESLFIASPARALLENMAPSRARGGRPSRTLTPLELQRWVMRIFRSDGAERLNALRDRARALAPELGLEDEFVRLEEIIGAALGTREVETASPALAAAQRGLPYDERREALFGALATHLLAVAPATRLVQTEDRDRLAMLPFYEAYFSNFIEGTEFTVEEARDIIFNGVIPSERPADAHDILGTFQVLSDDAEMRKTPATASELFELLQGRHARVMAGRPEEMPGEFKARANRAGTTEFVAPELVRGTLARGLEIGLPLRDPFARAVFMMFLVSEVHPFKDGNGRVARIMMNAELHAAGMFRIIIPTVFRNEYLSGLRALTHNALPGPLTTALDFAQRYTMQIDFSTIYAAKMQLGATNAFMDSSEAERRGIRLMLPSAMPR